jgi:hypothetical protein
MLSCRSDGLSSRSGASVFLVVVLPRAAGVARGVNLCGASFRRDQRNENVLVMG